MMSILGEDFSHNFYTNWNRNTQKYSESLHLLSEFFIQMNSEISHPIIF